MAKKTVKPKREATKRQLSRWEKQKKRQRLILSVGVFIIAAVVVMVASAWYITQYRPLRETVIRVNDTTFDMDYYIKMLKYYGQGQSSNYMYGLTDEMARIIEQNEVLRQGAMELGISVSDAEVDSELSNRQPPLSKDYRDIVRAEMLVQELLSEYFEKEVPVSADQRHVMAMLLESEKQVAEVRGRIGEGEDFGKLAGELSLDNLSKTGNGDLGWHPQDVLKALLATSVPGGYAFGADVGVLSEPLYDDNKTKSVGFWLIQVSERKLEPKEAKIRAMLLSDEQEAMQVRSRLEAGEDFAALAKELSQQLGAQENGGDLDWLASGTMSTAFDEFAFNFDLELNTLSEPIRDETVQTKGCYWLLKVVDKDDNREIEKSDRDLLKSKALDEWFTSLWDNSQDGIDDTYLDTEKKMWAVSKVLGG